MPKHLYVDIPLGLSAEGALCAGFMPGRATKDPDQVTCQECLDEMKRNTELMAKLAERHEAQDRYWHGRQEEEGEEEYVYARTEAQTLAKNMRRFLKDSRPEAKPAGAQANSKGETG